MTEIEYLVELALAVQRMKRDNAKELIAASPRSKRMLAETYEALQHWEEWLEEQNAAKSTESVTLLCSYCNAPLVMARWTNEETGAELTAFEAEPILASGLPPSFNYQLSFLTSPPQASVNLGLRTGTVWIRHELACGIQPKVGANHAIYRRRHATNMSHVAEAMQNTQVSMQKKLRSLRRKIEDEKHGTDSDSHRDVGAADGRDRGSSRGG